MIKHIEWGKITMDDGTQYKDVKITPMGHTEWDWNETGTHHVPGIQIDDIEELVMEGAELVILSKGYELMLQTTNEAEVYLQDMGIQYYILETEEAVDAYNEFYNEGMMVGALIHSTC